VHIPSAIGELGIAMWLLLFAAKGSANAARVGES
jgi:hypothetical protein